MSFLSLVFTVAALLVALFGANALMLAALYVRQKRAPGPAQVEQAKPLSAPAVWPKVTVQLPVYNEMYVVVRLIDAVAHMDYPRDRFHRRGL